MSRVLILSEDADLSEDLSRSVTEDGDEVTNARSVSEGREYLTEKLPQLLVLDGNYNRCLISVVALISRSLLLAKTHGRKERPPT
jgi:DNA-binding response OmpR family regulator